MIGALSNNSEAIFSIVSRWVTNCACLAMLGVPFTLCELIHRGVADLTLLRLPVHRVSARPRRNGGCFQPAGCPGNGDKQVAGVVSDQRRRLPIHRVSARPRRNGG